MFQIAVPCSRTLAALIGLCAVLCSPLSGLADSPELEKRLNERLLKNSSDPGSTGRVTESGLSVSLNKVDTSVAIAEYLTNPTE